MRNKNLFGVFYYAVIMLLAISVAFAVKPLKKISFAEETRKSSNEQYSYDYEKSFGNSTTTIYLSSVSITA